MSRRKIKTQKASSGRAQKAKRNPLTNAQLELAMKNYRERAMDDEAIRRYIYQKEFDMEFRYDDKYRADFARKSNMKLSRFNAALDRVIAEAWRNIKNGKVPHGPEKRDEGETGK
jgi:hypothetical protein